MRPQKSGFVPNDNYRAFLAGWDTIKKRGERAAGMMLVAGIPGVGKTTLLDKFVTDTGAVYLRARATTNLRSLMSDLAKQMPGVATTGSAADIQESVIAYLIRNPRPVVVDEIQHLIGQGAKPIIRLEALRDISDLSGCELVMVAGQRDVEHMIARHDQISRRISATVKVQPLTLDDMQVMLDKLAYTKIAPDLTAELHKQAGGRIGPVFNAIPAIDTYAERNNKTALCLADVTGMRLIYDWLAERGAKK